ncbi:MAG: PAS domain S-box protein, partial [Candidatus Zixiibacteriota bacterium]
MTECFNRAILTGIIDKSARDNVKSFPEEYLLIFMIFLSISLLVFLIIIYSKRKKTKRLIEDQTKFEILFHWNPEATAYLDPHHCVVNVNPVFEKLFGVSLREIKGKHINDIIIPDNLQKEALKIDLNPDKYTYYNTVREKRDGTSVSVSLSASTISINDKLYGYLVVYKDMTAYEIAQKALKESEERLRVIIDAMPIPILISRYPDGNILYANKHIGEMFGIPPEQLSTRKTEEFYFNPDDRPGLVEQLIKDGFLPSSEVHVKKEDGTPFWVIVSLQFMRYNNDQAILTSFYDITDRKQAEEALVESEERYRGLIESAREAIFSIDRKGTFLLMNSISAKRLGGTPENFIGKNMSELFPPHIVKSQMSSILKVFDTGNGVIEESVTVLQGEERQYRTSLQPIRDHSGEITSVLGIARDISEIVHTQQKLKEERDFISSLLDTANSLIVCLDKNAKITIFNKECERVTGYTRGEVIGKSWKEIFLPKEDHHEGLNNFSEWVRKQPRDMYDSLIKTKSGLTRTILWSNSVIFSSDSDDLTAIAVG